MLAHGPLGVALAILHIEWMTQRHYVDSVRDDQDLDPQFKSLLKHHWMEEAQHAKLDTLMVEAMVRRATRKEIDQAFRGIPRDRRLHRQGDQAAGRVEISSFVSRRGDESCQGERETVPGGAQGMRWTYLGSGMTHPNSLPPWSDRAGSEKQIGRWRRRFVNGDLDQLETGEIITGRQVMGAISSGFNGIAKNRGAG